ncbi:MAG: aquaporin [Actinomycetota bacterium]|nr:aquaporin [Actinomycetota bacterium]
MPGLRRYLVELVATFLLTLTVLGAASQDVLVGALAIGAMVTLLVRSGGHANPVLTLAAVVARRLPAAELLPCWAAQFVGALLAAALGRWLLEAPAVSPLQDVGVLALLVTEALFAFALCYVVLDAGRGDTLPHWIPDGAAAFAAGLTVLAAAALLDPVGAAAFNPAAAFAQVVAGIGDWSTIWVYLLACPAGAALAGLAAGQASSRPG